MRMLRTSIARLSASALFAAALALGCAAEPTEPVDATGGAAPGGGGAGADGGMGGTGGGGGDLCDQDCGAIQPPVCHVSVCNDGSHAGVVGQCVIVPAPNGTACDDGQFCTTNDACEAGLCVGGPANDCGLDPDQCESVVCDETAKGCDFAPVDNGTPCTSDDLCIAGAACSNGICSGGTTKDCFFAPVPNACHVPVCNPANGMCEPVQGNDGGPCVDTSDPCTVSKTCDGGQCVGGQPKDCSHLTQGCTMGVCDPSTGTCGAVAAGEGQSCDDLDGCTTGEICTSGVCGGGSPVTACLPNPDGCCPASCTEQNDYDCACPGTWVGGVCVYLPSASTSYTKAQAQAACQALGAGWDLCSTALICDVQTQQYLGASGCDCTGGASTCNCSGINVYVHAAVLSNNAYYIRTSNIPGCSDSNLCTQGSASCGVALCCKP
jgi:hypothetical protein